MADYFTSFWGIVKGICIKSYWGIYATAYKDYNNICWLYDQTNYHQLSMMADLADYDTVTTPSISTPWIITLGYDASAHTVVINQRTLNPYSIRFIYFTDAISGNPNLHIAYISQNYAVVSYLTAPGVTQFRKIYMDYDNLYEVTEGEYLPLSISTVIVEAMCYMGGDVYYLYKTGATSYTYLKTIYSASSSIENYYTSASCHKMTYSYVKNTGNALTFIDQISGYKKFFYPFSWGVAEYMSTGVVDWVQTGEDALAFVNTYQNSVSLTTMRSSNSVRLKTYPNGVGSSSYPRLCYDPYTKKLLVSSGSYVFEVNILPEEVPMDLNESLMVTTYGKRRR